ncbi:ThuA domain-containing protein [Euzebya rosea]|uniref:ThuA domain-containing protein n=1 Tax=Euzebya rosea TaxID=2052804 RepID=UPI000D3EDA5B|nr:ThuA domain-containing protein [Euzebya rosea]
MSRTHDRTPPRPLLGLLAVLLLAVGVPAAGATEPEPQDPLDILVFSQPYGFSHTDAIVSGAEWFLSLNARPDEYRVVVAHDDPTLIDGLEDDGISAWEWLRPERLATFDLLVWNNSTGEVPFPADERDDLRGSVVEWVRDGHGILGVHSAADSNYTWPAFHELIGGQYDGHWYSFGGIEVEPYRLQLNVEDPDIPLLDGVDPAYDSHDETYRWQMDVRPDVHVIHSMDNTSIGAQGALYHYEQPITWCRPVGGGRSFYTNIGHSGYHFADVDYTTMLTNAVTWTGGRMTAEVDCSVPVDPATGVSGADRLGAAWATVEGARTEVSTYSGGQVAVTDIVVGESAITFPDVDLTDVEAMDLFAVAHTIAAPSTVAVTGGPYHQRITPATGGTVEVRTGDADGPMIGTATLLPTTGGLFSTHLPAALDPVVGVTGPVASWTVLTADVIPTEGTHDVVLTFAEGPAGPLAGANADRDVFGSLAWIAPR